MDYTECTPGRLVVLAGPMKHGRRIDVPIYSRTGGLTREAVNGLVEVVEAGTPALILRESIFNQFMYVVLLGERECSVFITGLLTLEEWNEYVAEQAHLDVLADHSSTVR